MVELSHAGEEVFAMPQIIPIKDLKNTSEISDMCHKADEPIYITKNGYGDMVIMSMEIYESTMRHLAMYKDIEISEQQIQNGQVKDAGEALQKTRAKYGI
jgi:PHD/YefM family antitoxin component YafN of YafNO toxin-antitoxin module